MTTQNYRIEGMDCADCAAKITKGVRLLPGVSQVELNFPNDVLKVEGDPASEAVIKGSSSWPMTFSGFCKSRSIAPMQ